MNKKPKKKNEIRARLTIYDHEGMTDSELRRFKEWIKIIIGDLANYKRGDLSKVFCATLYKYNPTKKSLK